MKIAFRISKLGFGGAEQVFLSLAKQFVSMPYVDFIFVVDSSDGENVKTAKSLGFNIYSLEVKRTLHSIIPMKRFIEREKPDVIISAYTDTNAACLLAGVISRYKSKIIVSEHASLNEHWKSKGKLKRFLLSFYVTYVYRLADSIVCVSNGLKFQVTSLLGSAKKVETIFNPVRFSDIEPIERQDSNKPDSILKLLAVGRVCEQKNYETLLNAVSVLSRLCLCQLKIVGGIFSQTEYQKLQSKIFELGIEDLVVFAGYSENVSEFYKDADVFVLSSAWEGFGNVIVEAMAFGLPVVSTNCNYGPNEILENGKYGRLVNTYDYEALAKQIYEESIEPLTTRSNLIERSKDFSEVKIFKQYYDLIIRVLNDET